VGIVVCQYGRESFANHSSLLSALSYLKTAAIADLSGAPPQPSDHKIPIFRMRRFRICD
jgi:hypothetical protein